MIHCHLAQLMAREQLRIADVARATGLNRSTVKALKEGRATRVELPDVDALCRLFGCSVGDLFEYTADAADSSAAGREIPS